MSLIVSEVYDALVEAGTSEEKARAAAGAIPVVEWLATKEDVGLLKDDIVALRRDLTVLKDDIVALRRDLTVLRGDFTVLRGDLTVLRHDLTTLKMAVFSAVPAILGLLVKLVFFP